MPLRSGQLVEVLPGYRMHHPTAYAVYPHARNLSPKVRSFVDFLAEYFRGTPSWDVGRAVQFPNGGDAGFPATSPYRHAKT